MTAQFQCTFDDFREAHTGYAAAAAGRREPRSPWAGALGRVLRACL